MRFSGKPPSRMLSRPSMPVPIRGEVETRVCSFREGLLFIMCLLLTPYDLHEGSQGLRKSLERFLSKSYARTLNLGELDIYSYNLNGLVMSIMPGVSAGPQI